MALPLTAVTIEGYRSVKRIAFPVGHLSVLNGRNGVGKTNLYRALEIVQAAARGTITREITAEGGFDSVRFADPKPRRHGKPVRVKFAVELGDLVYSIEIGLPTPTQAALTKTEPMVKAESLTYTAGHRPVELMKREGPAVWLRDEEGRRHTYENALLPSETALTGFQDSARFLELDLVRRTLLDWRFYHQFRTDRDAPARQPSLTITTPTLASDGHDLAAALATVSEINEDMTDVTAAIDDAFPGAWLDIGVDDREIHLSLKLADMPRALGMHEISDGTLSWLCLVAALNGYRLPGFIALNEPEASLHADLIGPLARLIARAAGRDTQIWVVTHARALAEALEAETGVAPRTVIKRDGATWLEGLRLGSEFADEDDEEYEDYDEAGDEG
ncbi:MAG: AAA family ATPase [Alphaproteobacteria bacterium]|jgi:predicted ATPase